MHIHCTVLVLQLKQIRTEILLQSSPKNSQQFNGRKYTAKVGQVILVQYSDKFMHSIVLYSIVLSRSHLYCIVNLLFSLMVLNLLSRFFPLFGCSFWEF